MKTDISVQGGIALDEALKDLPPSVQRRVLRAAVAAGASPVNKAAKGFAPVLTKALKKSIGIKTKTYKNGTVVAVIGVRRDPKFSAEFYQHIVHDGAKPHTIKPKRAKRLAFQSNGETHFARRINHPGSKGNPFLAKAWNSAKGPATAAMTRVASVRTQIELQKLAAKSKRK